MNRKNPIRAEIIRIKLAEIEESVELVCEHLPLDINEFIHLGLLKDGIYKRIECAIENVLDICAIINADLILGIPESEDDIISSMVNNGIIRASVGEEIRQMKRFRNIVVHQYGKIDDVIAYEILSDQLASFDRFREQIYNFLQ